MHAPAVRRLARAAALAAAVLAAAGGLASVAAAHSRAVHLRGTAYEFNSVHTLLAGATIRVAELPGRRATVGADGTYDLVVPDHARVTPYIEAAGHHTIYLQTFTTDGEDLANVNFQTPSDGIYQALAALLHVRLDSAGNPAECAIVSTFNTKNVRDLDYAGFIAYGAHGVAGATASATPALPKPIYFNEFVIPDPAQALSSKDGGVIWTEVPAGVYTIRAQHPTTRFASFVASCRPGRIVNANPPWGLHELAPANPARVSAAWSVRGRRTLLRALSARNLAPQSVVRVRCAGWRCPFGTLTLRPSGDAVDLRAALGDGAVRLRPGQTLEVAVSSHAYNGTVTRWRIRAGRAPTANRLCVPLGNTKPRRRC